MATPTNPLLDQIRQQARANLQPDTPPPTLLPPPGMDTGAPPIMQSPQQSVTAPRGTLQGEQNERNRLVGSKPGLSQVYDKISGSDFGQNHPVAGKLLGGAAQGLASLGNIALSGAAPRLAGLVPGTSEHHAALIGQQDKNINQMQGEQEKEAQTREANARANVYSEPNITPLPTAEGYQGFNTKTGETKPITGAQGESLTPYEKPEKFPLQHAVLADGSVVAITQDPKNGQVTAEQVYKGDPAIKTEVKQLEIGGKPHQVLVNSQTGATIKDLGETGEKPPTVNVNAGLGELDRISGRLAKPYQSAHDAGAATLGRIQQTLHSVDAGYVGQGLAIPELLTSVVSGQGTGVRITQPELNAITAARGIKGDAEAWFNTLAGKGKLTDTDKAQIKAVLSDARQRIEDKIRINSQALDKINGAANRGDAVSADKDAREALDTFERTGHFVGQSIKVKGQTKTVTAVHPDGSFDAN